MAVECTYCEERVNAKRGIYIKCSTCQDVLLCLECFSAGATIGGHESDHPYELIDCGSFSIIDESWKAHEELSLLEAVELYGVGSWADIANAVKTRSAEECCERYLKIYVDNFFGRCAWRAIDRDQYKVHDHTCNHNQPLSPSLSLPEKHKIVDIAKEQQIRLGYMPKRDDFEREFDNEAELLVSKLPVNANDDTELDQELKIAHINMYTDRLRERFRRKRIVLEYNLVKLFFHMHPEENDPHAASNNLLATNSVGTSNQPCPADNEQHLNGKRITPSDETPKIQSVDSKPPPADEKNQPPPQNTILHYFRRVESTHNDDKAPVTTVSGSNSEATPTYNNHNQQSANSSVLSSYFSDLSKSIAEQDFNTMEKKLRTFCQFTSAEEHNQLIRNLAREKELKVKIKDLMRKRKNQHQNSTTTKSEASKSATSTPLRQNEPIWRLLSEGEKRLCISSKLKPSQYISYKALMINEHSQKKRKNSGKALSTDDIDKPTKKRIVNFLTRNNWIKV